MTDLSVKKYTYFASDFHLGLKAGTDPIERERHVVSWLTSIQDSAEAIYLVGDVFDFWWEYKKVVPKGFTRFLGKISELTDAGIDIHFFTGNHDMWVGDYLSEECGMTIHTGDFRVELQGKKFYISHGEGLGVDDRGYALLLKIFRNKFLRRLYSALHPRIGIGIGHRWSLNSRLAKSYSFDFKGAENEPLFSYSRDILKTEEVDFFIFGHRHIALDHEIGARSRIFILGNWFNDPVYLSWDGNNLILKKFPYR